MNVYLCQTLLNASLRLLDLISQWLSGKGSACNGGDLEEARVQSLSWEDSLEKEMATHSVVLPGNPHRQRGLACYSLWIHKESDTTERLNKTMATIFTKTPRYMNQLFGF